MPRILDVLPSVLRLHLGPPVGRVHTAARRLARRLRALDGVPVPPPLTASRGSAPEAPAPSPAARAWPRVLCSPELRLLGLAAARTSRIEVYRAEGLAALGPADLDPVGAMEAAGIDAPRRGRLLELLAGAADLDVRYTLIEALVRDPALDAGAWSRAMRAGARRASVQHDLLQWPGLTPDRLTALGGHVLPDGEATGCPVGQGDLSLTTLGAAVPLDAPRLAALLTLGDPAVNAGLAQPPDLPASAARRLAALGVGDWQRARPGASQVPLESLARRYAATRDPRLLVGLLGRGDVASAVRLLELDLTLAHYRLALRVLGRVLRPGFPRTRRVAEVAWTGRSVNYTPLRYQYPTHASPGDACWALAPRGLLLDRRLLPPWVLPEFGLLVELLGSMAMPALDVLLAARDASATDPAVRALLVRLLHHGDRETRLRALARLGRASETPDLASSGAESAGAGPRACRLAYAA